MHIANITSASLDDLIEPVDLGQTPADIVFLSFNDSDLCAVASAHAKAADKLPSMRLAALRHLRHPMSVDLWIERVATHARVIVVRLLGGYDWWSYGCDQLAMIAKRKGIKLVLLPGECHARDERLAALSSVDQQASEALLACFREGGSDNMLALLTQLARLSGAMIEARSAKALPRMGFYHPLEGIVPIETYCLDDAGGKDDAGSSADDTVDQELAPAAKPINAATPDFEPRPVVLILFYRSVLLADDIAPIDALVAALHERGLSAVPMFVPTLKDRAVVAFVKQAARTLSPSVLVTTTAFAAASGPSATSNDDHHNRDGGSLFADIGVPVLQAILATTQRDQWRKSEGGLGVADLAMNVVLPELDGRILAGVVSFKAIGKDTCEAPAPIEAPVSQVQPEGPLEYTARWNRPEPSRIDIVADRIKALNALQRTAAIDRRLLIILPDYPGADGRTGYAVGLDVPQSVLAILVDLQAAGYDVGDIPSDARSLLLSLATPLKALERNVWRKAFSCLPAKAQNGVEAAWGLASNDPVEFHHLQCGNITIALAPDRGHHVDRRADYHDLALAPRHELLAFGHWARQHLQCHAVIHCGAHGTIEWLPGKAVGLSETCFPELIMGAMPIIYPFLISNPGEAAQAKRRIAALTLGHLPPPMIGAGLSDDQIDLERLVDEYVQADGLDHRRRDRLSELILDKAAKTGLDQMAGVKTCSDAGGALKKIDAWLCDLKDFAIKDGQHVYGRLEPDGNDPQRMASVQNESNALLAALEGRFIAPGPSGAPQRGRLDVLPTGRNMFAIDPRLMPTSTAYAMGKAAGDETLRYYCQEHGEPPRALVMDLWGSASLRTGGEEIAMGLALMGCRPIWDFKTGRVTGIDVLPPAMIGRPRVDVTWRISGLFRDMFAGQIALISAAIKAVAARREDELENPLAAIARTTSGVPQRIFGSSPGTYGSGAEDLLASGSWERREEIGQAYLDAAAFAFDGAAGEAVAAPGAFAQLIKTSDLLLHTSDDPGRDLLEGGADVAHMGGFSAALKALGSTADVISLDTSNPANPRAHSLVDAVTRTVYARAINKRYIAGQMRHGPRGASDFAETVDRLVAFAETTSAIPGTVIEALHDAYVADPTVRAFLLHENPAAARAIAKRLLSARDRNLWHPQRNSIDVELSELLTTAQAATGDTAARNTASNKERQA